MTAMAMRNLRDKVAGKIRDAYYHARDHGELHPRGDLAHLGSPIAAPFASPRYRRCSPAGLSVIRHDIARNELTE